MLISPSVRLTSNFFEFRKTLPVIMQAEAAECGLACLAMLAKYHGKDIDLRSFRAEHTISLKGATLSQIIRIGERIGLLSRAIKLDLPGIAELQLPCIIHWNFNHFVVLKARKGKDYIIHDPAQGERYVSLGDFSDCFTGVALEVWPSPDFTKTASTKHGLSITSLFGTLRGVAPSILQIAALAFSLELLALTNPFFIQMVVDEVIPSGDSSLLTLLAVIFLSLSIFQQSISVFRSWLIGFFSANLNVQWRGNVLAHLVKLPISYFEQRHIGDVVSRFGSSEQIQRAITTSFLEAVLDGVMGTATFCVMLFYSPGLTLVTLIALVLYLSVRSLWHGPLRRANHETISDSAKLQSHFMESVRGIRTIKTFQQEQGRTATWLAMAAQQANADLSVQRLQIAYKFLNSLIFAIEGTIIMGLGALLVIQGAITVGALMAFISYKTLFSARFGSLIDKFFELRMLGLHAERLSDIVLSTPETANWDYNVDDLGRGPLDIEVRDLTFAYGEHEKPVLKDLSFKIAEGENVAIVGPSGSGKSTLAYLLLGLLTPSSGTIHFGSMEIGEQGRAAARALTGAVLQDDALFSGTIAQNVAFFSEPIDYEFVERCARLAAVHDDVIAMPMGYESLVGDMGSALSGGQKQRLLLARALYKRPRILILDEATSHLDVLREQQVNQSIRSLNITRIVIAHRPETIATADRVIDIHGSMSLLRGA